MVAYFADYKPYMIIRCNIIEWFIFIHKVH